MIFFFVLLTLWIAIVVVMVLLICTFLFERLSIVFLCVRDIFIAQVYRLLFEVVAPYLLVVYFFPVCASSVN